VLQVRGASAGRLTGVDVARCAALIGMAATHVFPSTDPDGSTHLAHVVAAGRASALFALLAGVSLALVCGGRTPPRGRSLWAARAGVAVRAAALVGLGLLLGRVDSPPLVILAYYGVLFLVALPVLGLGPRPLWALAAVAAVVTPAVSHLLRQHVDPAPVGEPWGADAPFELLLTGTYPVLTWTTYLFAGLAVGRGDLRRVGSAARLLVVGLLAAVTARALSGWLLAQVGGTERLARTVGRTPQQVEETLGTGMFGTTPRTDWRWLVVSAPHSGTTLDLVHTTGSALAVLGGCLLLVRVLPRLVVLPFAAAGSMTLTLYTVHVLALADGSPVQSADRTRLWWAHVLVGLAVATLWRTQVGRGPLEALLAWLSGSARRAVGGGGPDRRRALASRP
jgi:uncharacterized membrane protein YeiB